MVDRGHILALADTQERQVRRTQLHSPAIWVPGPAGE